MSRYRRPRISGATLFLTINLADRRCDTLVTQIDVLRAAVRRTRRDHPFHIDAWVVLPDHMHCIWTLPEADSAYALRVGAIKSRFSRTLRRSGFTPTPGPHQHGVSGVGVGINPDLRGDVGIWQRRFWEHHIRDAEDYENHLRYCWHNPVCHGLVENLRDWPYSSWHRDHP